MPPSLRELIPGYNPQAGLGELIPGYASAAPLPTLRSPETQQMEDVAAARDMSELAKGYKSSRMGSEANYLASRESTLRRMGDVPGADQLRSEVEETQRRAQLFAPAEHKGEDLQWNPQRIGNWFASGVGQVGGSMVDSLASGTAAGYAAKGIGLIPHPLAKAIGAAAPLIGAGAAAVPNVLNMRGETLNDMNNDKALMARTTPAERDNAAWLSGGAQGLVDTAVPGVMVGHLLGSGFKKGVHALSAAPRIGAMALGEGTQELTQEAMKKATLGYLNPERDTAGDMSDYGNALASGVFMAPHAAASVGIDNAFRRLGTKGDGKNGDAIPLDEKPAVDLESHLIEGSKQKLASHVIADQRRQFLLGDMPPEAVAAPEAWLAENEPKRQAALLEELGKLANDPKAKQLAQQVSAVDLSDPLNSMHPAMDEAAEYVVDKSGLTLEASREAIDKKAAAAGKSKKKNAMAVAGMKVETAPLEGPDKEIAKARVGLANDILRQNYVKLGGKTSSDHMDLLSNLSDEIGAMASPGVVKYPTAGDINRAQRVGQTISELLGDQAKDVLDHIGRVVRAKGAAFEAMVERAISPVKVSSLDRTTAADELVKLIPAPVEARLYAKGVDLSSGEAKERLLRNMEDFADGMSGFGLEAARKLFGAETFDAMLAHVGQPITEREAGPTKIGSVMDDRQLGERNPKSSDDIGGSWNELNDGRRSEEDQSQFEIEGEEKSLSAIPPEAMVFHHGTKEGTVRTLENAWKETRHGLPQLIRLDTSTKKRDSETHEQHAARTEPGGAQRMLEQRIADVRKKAEKSLGAMRDRYVVASTTAKAMMDRQNMQPSKRAELFLRYLEKEKHPGAGEVGAMHGVLRELERMNRVMTEFIAHRDSLSPSGKKLTINERNALGAPRINLARLKEEMLSSQDAAKVDALFGGDKESGAKGEQQTVRRMVGLAKIIHNATLAARQHMNDTMAQDPLIRSYMDKVQKERSTPVEFDEVVNHFFSEHHLVTAEQGTNRDYLQMNLMEFREMAIKGAANLKSAWLAVKHMAPGKQAGMRARVEASMNLIRFSSEHSTAEDKQIAIPAYLLVKWVRDMRNAHTKDEVEGGGDIRGRGKSNTRVTEDYKRDLLEGITALMQGGLTEGLPYIINDQGVREDFGTPKFKGKAGDRAQQMRLFNDSTPMDMLPPSLDLDGTTQQKAMRDRAIGAEKRREANRPVLGRSLREAAVKHIKAKAEEAAEDALKDEELSQDTSDVQDAKAVQKAEDEANGSRTRDEERRYVKELADIMAAAADAPVKPLTYGRALNTAAKVAERLWRAYAPRGLAKEAQEAHKKALASILAYANSIKRDKYSEDRNELLGGSHYAFPLAALLTPRHLTDVATKHPADLKLLTMLRSRVASELVQMAKPAKGEPTITRPNLSKLVDFLSGQADIETGAKLDAIVPTDPEQLKAWKESRKSDTKWEGGRVPWNQHIGFLNNMAADYVALVARRAAKPMAEKVEPGDRSDKLPVNDGKAVVGNVGARAEEAKAEQTRAELIENFILDAKAKIANDEGAYPAARKIEAKIRRAAKALGNLDGQGAKTAPPLAPTTKGSDKGKPVRLSIKQRLIERTPKKDGVSEALKGVLAEVSAPVTGARSTERGADGRIKMTDAQVKADTAAANEGVDKLVSALGSTLEAKPMTAKAEPVAAKDTVKHNAETIDAAQVRLNTAPDAKAIEVSGAIAHFKRTLAPTVRLMLEDAFPGMKGLADWDAVQHLARISTANPLKIMQLAYHESMHAFFTTVLDKHPEVKAMLERAMSDPKMVARLEHLLRHSPDAIADMKADPEERAAYAYQFWAAGMLDIDKKPATFFEKVQALMRRVFGAVRDSEKALAIFEGFHKGAMVEPSAAGLAITKVMQTGEWKAQFLKRWDKQWQSVYSEVMTAHDVLRTSESATLRMLSTMWWSSPADPDSAGKTGVIDRRGIKTNQYESMLDSILGSFEGVNQERDLKALAQFMNGVSGEYSEEVKAEGEKLHKLMANFYEYAKKAGVEMGVRDNGNFFPVVYDLEKMVENKAAFTKMLIENYSHVLQSALGVIRLTDKTVTTLDQVADAMHQAIVDRGGVDQEGLEAHREDGILNPYFASQNKRTFDWISKEHRGAFLSEDIVATTTRYFHQGVRSAEYVRAFGNGGQKLKDMMAREGGVQMVTKDGPVLYTEDGLVIKELKAEAAKQGLKGVKADEWVNRREEDAQRAMGAIEGVLGKDITAGTRKLHSAMMVYQALRTLPLSLFSAMLDPNGIKVAGGTTQNMLDAYVHGLKNVVGTWKDVLLGNQLHTRGDAQDTLNASIVGSIAPTVFLEGRGAAHTSEYTAGPARKINRGLFLGNGLTMWDRSMRIMATKAAMQSIANNEKNAVPEHSARWLKELGLKQGEVKLDKEGQLIITAQGLATNAGQTWKSLNDEQKDEYREQALKVHTAINRWVNRAITSPNAALRPSRMSDPHYAMFFQLKSFTYAFQKTTMNYALNEAKAGNPAALGQVAVGMPIMIAADVAKAMLTGGGSLPGYMANWTMADWVSHAWNRSGGNGIGQFGMDILHDPNGLIAGTASVVGGAPVSQAVNALTHPIGETLFNATPILNKLGGVGRAVRGMADMSE